MRNLLQVHAFMLSFSNHEMTLPRGAICAEAESKMWKFLITAIVATVTLATPIPGVSLMKALSSADFTRPPSPVRVGSGGARRIRSALH